MRLGALSLPLDTQARVRVRVRVIVRVRVDRPLYAPRRPGEAQA